MSVPLLGHYGGFQSRSAQSGAVRDASVSVWDRNVRPSLSRASFFGQGRWWSEEARHLSSPPVFVRDLAGGSSWESSPLGKIVRLVDFNSENRPFRNKPKRNNRKAWACKNCRNMEK